MKHGMIEVVCPVCNKPFKRQASTHPVYCSRACYLTARHARVDAEYEALLQKARSMPDCTLFDLKMVLHIGTRTAQRLRKEILR